MAQYLVEQAIALMQQQRFGEALTLLRRSIADNPTEWNTWYMAGQCCRFTNDIHGAVEHLKRAVQLNARSALVYQALGIAHQLRGEWPDSIEALRQAIAIDPDFELAYNSLALTQKKAGELEKALHNYDAGAKALARRLVKAMTNSRSSPILKHRDTTGTLWVQYAMFGMAYLAASAKNVKRVAFPDGAFAEEEERTERHGGLYWIDQLDTSGQTVRMYLPNYFNTFRESLRREAAYANLIGNRGTVLGLLGRGEESQRHLDEASEFLP
jgi:tetratricopeptide (TPR) repeat protein